MRTSVRSLLLATALAAAACAHPAATQTSATPTLPRPIADEGFLRDWAETFRFRLGRPTQIRVTPKGDAVLFLRASSPRSFVQDLWLFDPATGEERVLLTAEQILAGAEEQLSPEEKARRERLRLAARGIAGYSLSSDGERILVPLSGRLFVIERESGRVRELPDAGGYPVDPRFSPDGTKVVTVREGDIYVIDVESGRQRRLTVRPHERIEHGLAEFVAQEEMGRMEGSWFSPDGRLLAYQQTDVSEVEVNYIADPTDPRQPPQPWPYPRPGKANAKVRLGIVPVTGGRTVWVDWDAERHPYLATVTWPENGPLTLVVQNRTQTEEAILAVDPKTGKVRTLFVETDPAWLNLDQQMPRWLPDGSGFLWTTERNGAWQLELRSADGELVRAITEPSFGYQGLVHLGKDHAIVAASTDPTQRHLWKVPLAGGEPEQLSEGEGLHDAVYAADGSLAVHTLSPLSGEPSWRVVRQDGSEAGRLLSRAERPPFQPNLELVRLGGEHDFAASVLRPRNFDPGLRYPVIVYVYAGPLSQVVTAAGERYLLQQWMADHGFVVVSIDGRGTPNRGRNWERVLRGDLIDVPLADQVAGLRQLGARFPELDLDRVGIYGWSFGGYFTAMAVMRAPEVYRVGVAGAPVAEWLDYDTHYTERYLGLPEANEAGYRNSSVLTWAKDLERPLLIVHGTADDNVYFSHALAMSDALFRAGKPHDFLPLAGFTHMVPDPLVTTRLYTRIVDYLARHLGQPVPRANPEESGIRSEPAR